MQSKPKSKRRSRCRYTLSYLNIRNLGKIAIGFLLLTLIITTSGQDEADEENKPAEEENNADNNKPDVVDDNNVDKVDTDSTFLSDGHGTIHEKLGQAHYPEVELTAYQSKAIYTVEKNYTTWPIHPAYNITHFIFDTVVCGKPALPPGKTITVLVKFSY